jgi:hypothetical protein
MKSKDELDINFKHLTRAAYALADALFSTHEIREIFIQDKDMDFEEWSQSIRNLLTLIDMQISIDCGISVIWTGLHACLDFPKTKENQGDYQVAYKPILGDARQFGGAFCQVIKDIISIEKEMVLPPKRNQTEKSAAETIDLCQQMVYLIFNDLGIQSADLASIY